MLLTKGKITSDHINLLKFWKHSGFQVYCDPRIHPRKKEAMENLARYITRASFSQERMTYPRKSHGSSTAPRTTGKKRSWMISYDLRVNRTFQTIFVYFRNDRFRRVGELDPPSDILHYHPVEYRFNDFI